MAELVKKNWEVAWNSDKEPDGFFSIAIKTDVWNVFEMMNQSDLRH